MNKKELKDETLENVSGGALKEEQVDAVMAMMEVIHKFGLTKEKFLQIAEDYWKRNSTGFSTDGSQEDLDALLDKINNEFGHLDWAALFEKYKNKF